MRESHVILCQGCGPARTLFEDVRNELAVVDAYRTELTGEPQLQSWRSFYDNHSAGDQAIVRRSRRYADAEKFAGAMANAAVVGCAVHEGHVRNIEQRALDVMAICPRILARMIEAELIEPAGGAGCASGSQIGALQEEFDDARW